MCRFALILASLAGRDQLLERGAAVHAAWLADADFYAVAAALDDLIAFRIDIDTAEVSLPSSDNTITLAAHPGIADMATRIDGVLLDSMDALWFRGKGLPDPVRNALLATQFNIHGWQPSDLLAWSDVCSGVRQDCYVLDDRVYEATEMYCPAPDCDCGEVLIHFGTLTPRGAPSPGHVIVQRSGAIEIVPEKKGRDRLERLWNAFLLRYPAHLDHFARRYPLMKHVGLKIVPPPSITIPPKASKIGRNDACPCGSGKKYKKCCGEN